MKYSSSPASLSDVNAKFCENMRHSVWLLEDLHPDTAPRHFLMSMSSSVKMCAIPCVAAKNMMPSIAILRNDHGFYSKHQWKIVFSATKHENSAQKIKRKYCTVVQELLSDGKTPKTNSTVFVNITGSFFILNARRRSKCKLCCTFKQITIGPNWGYTIGKKTIVDFQYNNTTRSHVIK